MKEYKTIERVAGPLIFVKNTEPVAYGDLVEITLEDGKRKTGQVLDTSEDVVIVQLFEGASGISKETRVKFLGENIVLPVSENLLGRLLNGAGKPLDGGPEVTADKKNDVNGAAINPISRENPSDFIQTGISTIDSMNTLVRGQKLPIFSGSGLPHNELALQIARQAKVKDGDSDFVVIFAAMGITNDEAQHFISDFEKTGALNRSVVFLNLANDPAVERLVTPRLALTAAEYFAFEKDKHVLVILTDMTNYAESLREIGAAREEIPGRRGYPGYMYTDFASIYERAGIIKGKKGSVTQLPILTMVGDDNTHPIPDLTGYITEGQIVLSRTLHGQNIYPGVDILPSLSRLMRNVNKKTREDHSQVSDQAYASYAQGKEVRGLAAIVGEESLNDRDKKLLKFASEFEKRFVRQHNDENRSIEESLDICWDLFEILGEEELTRISPDLKKKRYGNSKTNKS